MLDVSAYFPLPLPDDPKKWDGWSKYKSSNLYERLCLNPSENPSNEVIEEHCRELLRWWQKKLPLKNQPSNPMAQLLRPGLDESSRYLTQARVELLNPERRRQMDSELASQAQEHAVAEFHKYLTFALADGTLTADEERNLIRFGIEHGLAQAQMAGYIEAELRDSGAHRVLPAPAAAAAAPVVLRAPRPRRQALEPKDEFLRMLRLTGLDSDGLSDETRDTFVSVAGNLGLEADEAEALVDQYLDRDGRCRKPRHLWRRRRFRWSRRLRRECSRNTRPRARGCPAATSCASRRRASAFPEFCECFGAEMLLVRSGDFVMGSDAFDAPPNEKPLTRVTLSRFYMSRHLVTNAEYEQFDPTHARKRAAGAGDRHPVVYVSSLEAIKYCQWLTTRERRNIVCRPKRSGSTLRRARTAGSIHGATKNAVAI
jgi:hypothetical protein